MKATKKRLVLGIAGAALLCVGATFTTLAATAEAPITDETMLANIEALSSGEGSGGDREDCFYMPYQRCPLITISPSGGTVPAKLHYEKKTGWI